MHDIRRRSRSRITVLLAVGLLVISAAAPGGVAGAFTISLDPVVGGFESPTQVTNANDDTDRLFVVEQQGTIRVVENGAVKPGYFLDIRSIVGFTGERGLLGLAFHPDFKTNHHFFVYFTRNDGDIVVRRYTTNSARTSVVSNSGRSVLRIEHSAETNHNGGALAFGPRGYLFIGVGDGGGSGDPGNDAQEKTSMLGKILRININGSGAGTFDRYSIPGSNPFAGRTPGLGAIWAYGLRNPWRISFDRGSGALYIADVGQSRREEINRESASFGGGRNYGWNAMEGSVCYKPSKCPKSGDTLPIAEYTHISGNCSITGGYVYRGPTQAELVGQYVFADFCSGRIWTLPHGGTAKTLRADTNQMITSFGESEDGELYAVTASGSLYQVLSQ